jgi:hypothetical protein
MDQDFNQIVGHDVIINNHLDIYVGAFVEEEVVGPSSSSFSFICLN